MSLVTQPADSLVELRALEKMLHDNGQREAGVFLSQMKLIITKAQHGIVVERNLYLNLLLAVQRIPKDGQGGKK